MTKVNLQGCGICAIFLSGIWLDGGVVCSPYPDMFQERVGLDLSVLVGKTLEAAGQVESPRCGHKVPKGSIFLGESKRWQVH
jgi:hypothetical protein